ncbi:hypothetical protein [Nonomuraea sp. SBT364]|uniref:hypothetical protein n=1 Tax=Nonomuraea sp. SBT364 TaxID=1580530 RepID=UPI00066B0630|nr:hypothetical protein [Nonomuraea sp. SBT364]
MDLDEVSGRLYGLAPAEFTAARTAEAAAAKEAGNAALAREIGKLRKPTVSAWAVNRISREHPGELDELLELGRELREAWQAHDAGALAELTRRRGEVAQRVAGLVREELSPAAAAEVDQTLDAAVVDAGAAEEVRLGRLAKPLRYSGFAPAPAPPGRPAPRRRESGTEDEPAPARGKSDGDSAAARRRAEEEASARRKAEAEARKAREREEAEAAHEEWSQALEEAERVHAKRAGKVARLEAKLAKARNRLTETEQRLEVTRREERHARRRLDR